MDFAGSVKMTFGYSWKDWISLVDVQESPIEGGRQERPPYFFTAMLRTAIVFPF